MERQACTEEKMLFKPLQPSWNGLWDEERWDVVCAVRMA